MMFMPARQLSRTRHTVRQMGIFGPHESLFEFDFWATQRHFWRGILAITFEVYMRNSTSALVRSRYLSCWRDHLVFKNWACWYRTQLDSDQPNTQMSLTATAEILLACAKKLDQYAATEGLTSDSKLETRRLSEEAIEMRDQMVDAAQGLQARLLGSWGTLFELVSTVRRRTDAASKRDAHSFSSTILNAFAP